MPLTTSAAITGKLNQFLLPSGHISWQRTLQPTCSNFLPPLWSLQNSGVILCNPYIGHTLLHDPVRAADRSLRFTFVCVYRKIEYMKPFKRKPSCKIVRFTKKRWGDRTLSYIDRWNYFDDKHKSKRSPGARWHGSNVPLLQRSCLRNSNCSTLSYLIQSSGHSSRWRPQIDINVQVGPLRATDDKSIAVTPWRGDFFQWFRVHCPRDSGSRPVKWTSCRLDWCITILSDSLHVLANICYYI